MQLLPQPLPVQTAWASLSLEDALAVWLQGLSSDLGAGSVI